MTSDDQPVPVRLAYLRIEELKAKLEKLELENRVMRDYINHLLKRAGGGSGLFSALFHDHGSTLEDSCQECSRLVSTFFPAGPWRGWVT